MEKLNNKGQKRYTIIQYNNLFYVGVIPEGKTEPTEMLKPGHENYNDATKQATDLIMENVKIEAAKAKEKKLLEDEYKEYVKKMKLDKSESKKFKRANLKNAAAIAGTALVVSLAVGTVVFSAAKLIDYINTKNASVKPDVINITEPLAPTQEPAVLNKIEVKETPAPKIVEKNLAPTQEPVKEMTKEEKINFIKENAENFKNEMNAIDNIKIDNNDALLELCYINGIHPYELNIQTADAVLDALTIYNNYIDKTFTNAKNYLCYNTELRGQNNTYTDVYSKYICDVSDKEIYSEIITKALKVINGCNTLEKEEALKKSYEYNTVLANDILADEYYENCSTPIQTLILTMCYNSPELLPENTKINIDTPIGIQQLENINNKKEIKTDNENYEIKFINDEENYTNIRNEYNHFYRIATRNATMEFFLKEKQECNQPLSNSPKTYTKSI